MQTSSRIANHLSIGLLAIVLCGCVAAIGNRPAERSGVTLGQELIDLQKAKDAGALTEAEYQQQRARLLNSDHCDIVIEK
jgi:hypothetical protein